MVVRTDIVAPIATLTLDRPERKNAISPQMANELLHALKTVIADQTVRVIVLTGSGKAFCAGGDFGPMSSGSQVEEDLPTIGDFADVLLAIVRSTKPIIAKVNGPALGGGLGLVAACPFAIASADAQLGTPEVSVGLFPMMIMAVLARVVPRKMLLEMMLLGQKFSADGALRRGLLTRVVDGEQLDTEVHALATQLAEQSPTAIARGLAAFAKMEDLPLAEALPMLREELFSLLGTEDAREGLTAFLQKRKPVWTGR